MIEEQTHGYIKSFSSLSARGLRAIAEAAENLRSVASPTKHEKVVVALGDLSAELGRIRRDELVLARGAPALAPGTRFCVRQSFEVDSPVVTQEDESTFCNGRTIEVVELSNGRLLISNRGALELHTVTGLHPKSYSVIRARDEDPVLGKGDSSQLVMHPDGGFLSVRPRTRTCSYTSGVAINELYLYEPLPSGEWRTTLVSGSIDVQWFDVLGDGRIIVGQMLDSPLILRRLPSGAWVVSDFIPTEIAGQVRYAGDGRILTTQPGRGFTVWEKAGRQWQFSKFRPTPVLSERVAPLVDGAFSVAICEPAPRIEIYKRQTNGRWHVASAIPLPSDQHVYWMQALPSEQLLFATAHMVGHISYGGSGAPVVAFLHESERQISSVFVTPTGRMIVGSFNLACMAQGVSRRSRQYRVTPWIEILEQDAASRK